MSNVTTEPPDTRPGSVSPLARLGIWVSEHGRIVAAVWVVLVIGLGIFAPFVEKNLSGAGWQAQGSQSVQARELAQVGGF